MTCLTYTVNMISPKNVLFRMAEIQYTKSSCSGQGKKKLKSQQSNRMPRIVPNVCTATTCGEARGGCKVLVLSGEAFWWPGLATTASLVRGRRPSRRGRWRNDRVESLGGGIGDRRFSARGVSVAATYSLWRRPTGNGDGVGMGMSQRKRNNGFNGHDRVEN
jgi:hypothetical protein